jgi:hypothetical protein
MTIAAHVSCAAVLGVMLSGCASGSVFFFADAGKYQYHNCEQLAAAAKTQSARERELRELIDKADQSAGGVLVSALAYRSDYVAVTEDLHVIETTAKTKNCQTPANWQSSGAIR